jgi:hypothetical protein
VFVVAIAELKGTVDDEAPRLAADLGATPYDARLLLASGPPIIARTTPDRAVALELLERLRARGHGAVACDASAVVSSSAMVAMRRPVLGDDAVTLGEAPGERLPYDDVLALVPAVHRQRVDATTHTRETQISMGRAIATGGMLFTRSVTKDTRNATEERTTVLYLFRRNGETPWILREHGTGWAGVGLPLAPSETENFRAAVAALRARAHGATYDDRLMSRRASEKTAMTGAGNTTTVKTSSEAGVDLLAHVIALWAARAAAYR